MYISYPFYYFLKFSVFSVYFNKFIYIMDPMYKGFTKEKRVGKVFNMLVLLYDEGENMNEDDDEEEDG